MSRYASSRTDNKLIGSLIRGCMCGHWRFCSDGQNKWQWSLLMRMICEPPRRCKLQHCSRGTDYSGLRTIYIHRDTEDPLESEDNLRTEFDLYIDGRNAAGARGGLVHLGEMLRSARGA